MRAIDAEDPIHSHSIVAETSGIHPRQCPATGEDATNYDAWAAVVQRKLTADSTFKRPYAPTPLIAAMVLCGHARG